MLKKKITTNSCRHFQAHFPPNVKKKQKLWILRFDGNKSNQQLLSWFLCSLFANIILSTNWFMCLPAVHLDLCFGEPGLWRRRADRTGCVSGREAESCSSHYIKDRGLCNACGFVLGGNSGRAKHIQMCGAGQKPSQELEGGERGGRTRPSDSDCRPNHKQTFNRPET